MAVIDDVDAALAKWVATISASAYEAPLMIVEFANQEANHRLRDLLLEHLQVPKTLQVWPPRKA